jgi:cell division protein ZapA
MPKVDISINGRFYAVACDEGQEARLNDLAGMIDERVRLFAGPVSGIGETYALVMASLMMADELAEAKANPPPALTPPPGTSEDEDDQELLVAAVEHLTDRIAVIADRLERA